MVFFFEGFYAIFIFFFIFSTHLFATQLSDITNTFPKQAGLSLIIYNIEKDQFIIKLNPDKYRQPASLQKISTAQAIENEFKSNQKLVTTLSINRNSLIINFSGDPSLTLNDLKTLIIKNKTKINHSKIKNIYLQSSEIENGNAIGEPWDILASCYATPSSGIVINHNCLRGKILINRKQNKIKLKIPSHVTITNRAFLTKSSKFCNLTLTPTSKNNYILKGCINNTIKSIPLNIAIYDSADYAKSILKKLLKESKIHYSGSIYLSNKKFKGEVIASHYSQNINLLLRHMLKKSDNLYANFFIKLLGHKQFKQKGNFSNGVAALKISLMKYQNINLKRFNFVDGSGLSRNNRAPASYFLDILKELYLKNSTIIDMLPVSSVDGTLKYRPSMQNTTFTNHFIAKTGSLFAVSNLAGVLKTKSGNHLIYIQMTDNLFPQQKFNIYNFEKNMLNFLYSNY